MDNQEQENSANDLNQSEIAANHLEKMLSLMGIESSVETEKLEDAMTCYRIQCSDTDARLLIGRRGQTLEALQYILRRLCNTGVPDEEHFIVDILNYRGDRRQSVLERVKTGAVAILNGELEYFDVPPMPAFERRVVHNYLHENFPDLASHSVGIGRDRHIVLTFAGTPSQTEQ
jgi:spoIIIJ-associated protein